MTAAGPFDPASVLRRDVQVLRRLAEADPAAFPERLAAAQARLAERTAIVPRIDYPPELPVSAHAAEIRRLLAAHQVIVVAGETGSGKTTQLPKICLEAGYGRRGMIGHTQPRRLAARSVAARIAFELDVPMGEAVGYAVRFSDQVGPRTLVKLVTDGLLLTEIRRDRWLDDYDVIIVDEAHERSLNIDFLLGYLRRLIERRRDLKVIITSATIDVAAFSAHFADAPVVEVGGRGFPVEVRYAGELAADEGQEAALLACLEDIETAPSRGARDVLVFQSGEREILETARLLRERLGDRWEVLPLYARLSARDQQRVFQPGGRRRVVLATNVAETSITVPNIGYVIDPGFARVSRYSYRSKLQRLPVEPISQASANQRMGRCGRIAPGVCFRLYSEADFVARAAYTDPEIRRTNLASVVLQMQAFGLGDVHRFPFLDPPDPRAIRDAEKLLDELGALEHGRLTPVGRTMARLPIDPRLARMLIEADRRAALAEVLVIASGLAVADPRDRPLEKQAAADQAHRTFADERSDFLAWVNLWNWFEAAREENTRAALTAAMQKRFLSPVRMREWRELHRQLALAVRELGMRLNEVPADYAAVHRALLAGSLSLIGQHEERGQYLGPRNLKFRIFPGSALAGRTPRWLAAGEIVETSRIYARSVAVVEPGWIEEAAGHLLKRHYGEPHWSARRGEVVAAESVSLYGLRLAENRQVGYGRIDPALARLLMIREGLVPGAVTRPPPFLQHNLELQTALREREARGRRRDILVDEDIIVALYAERLPDDLTSARELERWWRRAQPAERERLYFTEADLVQSASAHITEADYPSTLALRSATFDLKYRFAPGEPDDGVSVRVPIGLLEAVDDAVLEWSVPGFLPLVCEQWLRALPKAKRRPLAPLPDKVDAILALIGRPDRYRQGRLTTALGQALRELHGLSVAADDWDRARIEPHLLMNVQVLDESGKILAQGRDPAALRQQFADRLRARIGSEARARGEATDLRAFPADVNPTEALLIDDGTGPVAAFPALVDAGDRVDLKLLPSARAQAAANRGGYARLALLQLGQTVRLLARQLERERDLGLHYATLGTAQALRDRVLIGVVWYCFFEGRPLPVDRATFNERIAACRGELARCFEATLTSLRRILAERFELVRALEGMTSPALEAVVADARAQLAALVPADLLATVPSRYLSELPRYLAALRYRLANLQGKVQRNAEGMQVVKAFTARLERLAPQPGLVEDDWQRLRFDIEELRVALFAEPLGTRGRISVQRLERAFHEAEQSVGLV
ncbi:MAG: ATP-dependent RNA helicase HrpA [Pseudomonadales bacterium]|nr:ATP-dependent RNA helicase HrpA [Pseudomonadales bacterium]